MHRTALALVALLAPSCSAPRQEHDYLTGSLLGMMRWAAPQVREMLDVRGKDLTLWVLPEDDERLETHAATTGDRRQVAFRADVRDKKLDVVASICAHEATHAHCDREPWRRLPEWAEEGLAHHVAVLLVPDCADDYQPEDMAGYRRVAQLGVGGLRALCERARREGLDEVPDEWFPR